MTYLALGHRLPGFLSKPLFGDRERFGLVADPEDPSWKEWQGRYMDFYMASQRTSVGLTVNRAGYKIVETIDLSGRKVLEIGPAAIEHINHWRGRPSHWVNFDVRSDLLELAAAKLESTGIPHEEVTGDAASEALPFADDTFDVVFTFFALEHIHPLEPHLREIHRVLRPGGVVVGCIPCEGGVAWGLGRFLTSRRWLLRNTSIDPNRVLCWEHANFADFILNSLDKQFERRHVRFWPLRVPVIDMNLVASFVHAKPTVPGVPAGGAG